MNDYKEIIKELLKIHFSTHYTPQTEVLPEYKNTEQILKMFQGIIPHEPTDQHDIFEAMTELGFEKKLCKYKVDDVSEYVFLWELHPYKMK